MWDCLIPYALLASFFNMDFQMFFISPRNSLDAQISLVDGGGVTKMLISAGTAIKAMVDPILNKRNLETFVVPELEYFLQDDHVEPIIFNGSFDDYRMKPWLLLHTSGSTGNPKIVTIRHGYATTNDAYWLSPNGNELFDRIGHMRLLIPFPPFHMAGIIGCTSMSMYVDSTIILPPVAPLTAELINNIHLHGRVEFSMLPPALIVELAKNDSYLENLKQLKGVNFAGGPLPQETGDLVNQHIGVFTNFGSTEMLAPPMLEKPREHWSYFRFDMDYSGLQFQKVDNNLFEYVLVRDPKLSLVQAIFITFPDIDEYHSRDLFSKHPTEADLWKYEGRLDDVLVLNNAEKVNPIDMEGTITSCPDVTGALVVGQGKFQTALLIEPLKHPETDQEKEDMKARIWPYVQMANERCPNYGKIAALLVGFTDPQKPFARAGKGTIQRQASVMMYAKEIDELYASYEAKTSKPPLAPANLQNLGEAKRFLHAWFDQETRLGHLDDDQDIFAAGMDSLEVISLVRQINASLTGQEIFAKQIYDHPTIDRLAASLGKTPLPLREDEDDIDSWIQMQQVFNDTKARGNLREKSGHAVIKEQVVKRLGRYGSSQQPEYLARKDEKFLTNMVQPDGGRTAWLQVLASFLINSNWGLVNSFGAFQAFYQTEFLSDYSPSAIAWIGTVEVALLLIVGMYSGLLFDRGHFRVTLLCATVTLFFAMMMLSISTKYYQIMLTQGVLVGLSCGLLFVPSIALIPLYFRDRKGLALGIATAGGSFAGIIYPIIFRNLLNSVGFGWATRVIGFILLAELGLASLLVQPLDEWKRPSRKLYEVSALKEPPFAAFTVASFFSFCGILVPFFFTATFGTGVIGLDQDLAFYMIAVINAAQLFGRIIPGIIADTSVGGEYLLLGCYILCAVLGFAWIAVHNFGGYLVFLLIYGFASGMATALPAIVMPYVCQSLAVLGTRLGMLYGLAGIGALISVPVAAAAAEASSNGILGAQLWTGCCMAVAAVVYPLTAVAAVRRRKAIDSIKKTKARDIMRDLLRDARS